MTAAGKRFLDFAATLHCIKCGTTPVVLHHDTGCRSQKTGLELAKRNGPAYYAVLPVCPSCHAERESIGRQAFEESLGMGPGYLTELMLSIHCWHMAGR